MAVKSFYIMMQDLRWMPTTHYYLMRNKGRRTYSKHWTGAAGKWTSAKWVQKFTNERYLNLGNYVIWIKDFLLCDDSLFARNISFSCRSRWGPLDEEQSAHIYTQWRVRPFPNDKRQHRLNIFKYLKKSIFCFPLGSIWWHSRRSSLRGRRIPWSNR